MHPRLRRLVAAGALLCAPVAAGAQGTAGPASKPPLFTRNDAVAAGAVTAATLLLSLYDDDIAMRIGEDDIADNELLRTSRGWANRLNESTLGVGSFALWGVARLTNQRTLADVSIHVAEAVVTASVAAQLIRGPLGRARPSVADSIDPDDYDQYMFEPFKGFREFDFRAFPSIHTSSAFAAAAVLSGEAAHRWPRQKKWITPLAYAIAATPGLARMHLNQHWASDVLMGAFFGTMAGRKIVRYNHQVSPGNRVDRFFLGKDGVQQPMVMVQFRF